MTQLRVFYESAPILSMRFPKKRLASEIDGRHQRSRIQVTLRLGEVTIIFGGILSTDLVVANKVRKD